MNYSFENHKITGGIGADDEYWRFLEKGEFRLPRCSGCNSWIWPAHFRCGKCGSWDFYWVKTELSGEIYSWTRSWYAFDRVKERAEDLPYVTALVEVDGTDGCRVLGILQTDSENITVGMKVKGKIQSPHAKSKGYPSVVWELLEI